MFLKKNIFSLLCALLVMSHNSSKPINVGVDNLVSIALIVAAGVSAVALFVVVWELIKKTEEDLVNKKQRQQEQLQRLEEQRQQLQEQLKIEKNNDIKQASKEQIEIPIFEVILERKNNKIHPTYTKEHKFEIHAYGAIEKREYKINQDIEVLDISGDAVVEIDVDEQNDSRIEIVGYNSTFNFLNIKQDAISKKLIASQYAFYFQGENALKYKIYVKRLNAITISDKVWIQKINDHFDDAINILDRPPMTQEMARNSISEKYKTLPLLKIITQNSSRICHIGTNYITYHRNIDLCSSDTSSVFLRGSFNINVKTYNKSYVKLYAVPCVNVESRNMSEVVMNFCSNAIIDEYDASNVSFFIADSPFCAHHFCVYNTRSNKRTY